MASFKDIVKNAPRQSAFADGAVWTFRSMLEALQRNVLEAHDFIEDEVVETMHATFGERLDVHTVFDIMHDSDECCSAEVLCIDGVPALLYKRIGDRSDYTDGLSILDKALARELLAVLVEHRTKAAFARMEGEQPATTPEQLLWEGTQYLVPLSSSAFFVGSPKWACGFRHAFSSHKAYMLDEQGALVRVTGFVKWANNQASWESKADTHVATFTTERGEATFDARNVIFTLLEDKDELRELAADLSKPCEWQVVKFETVEHYAGAFVQVAQHIKGRNYCGFASIGFTDRAVAEAFNARFTQPQPGRFSLKLPALAEFEAHIDKTTSMPLRDE